jgi:hypothetical protein
MRRLAADCVDSQASRRGYWPVTSRRRGEIVRSPDLGGCHWTGRCDNFPPWASNGPGGGTRAAVASRLVRLCTSWVRLGWSTLPRPPVVRQAQLAAPSQDPKLNCLPIVPSSWRIGLTFIRSERVAQPGRLSNLFAFRDLHISLPSQSLVF